MILAMHGTTSQKTQARFQACLLDYGNTVVEFDERQIRFVLEHLLVALRRLVGPLDPATLERAMDRICSLPHEGDPPQLREVSPARQMELLLRDCYDGHAGGEKNAPSFSAELVEECDRVLQDLFVESITCDRATLRFLGDLSRRLRLGLVSNYPCGKTLRRSLDRLGIMQLLDPVVISGEVGYVKPHSSMFETALAALALPAESVLFVGDRWDMDMLGARDACMATCHHVGYTSDRNLDERYRRYKPDFRIHHLSELEEILFT